MKIARFKQITITIGKLPIIVEIEKDLVNIQGLFDMFEKRRIIKFKNNKVKIVIRESNKRLIKLSQDKKCLTITGSDVDNLYNPFNLIGILQAVFRFVGLHSIKNNFFLLHGSTALYNNKAVCFADDGSSTGKTISSVECALNSGKYIGDEFCFLDEKYRVLSYPFIPIHIRTKTEKYLKRFHKDKVNIFFNSVLRTKAGYFIYPKKIFKVKNLKKLSAFIFVHFIRNKNPYLKKLNKAESKQAILKCISVHLIKFFNPELDRMQFVQEKDSTKKIRYNKKIINKIKKELALNDNMDYIVKKIPCYQFYVRQAKDIIPLIEKLKF